MSKKISVLVIKENDIWVAQCLEYDINAQAKEFSDIFYKFEEELVSHIVVSLSNNIDPFSLPKAPKYYWDLYERANKICSNRISRNRFKAVPNIDDNLPEEQELKIAA